MNENRQNERDKKFQELEVARLGYQTAVSLVGLVSQEIYSRFGAMLIVHGLLLTVIFHYQEGRVFVPILATIVGFSLCPLWLAMVQHGLFYQNRFRKIASDLEDQYFNHIFRIFSSAQYPDQDMTLFAKKEGKGLKRISAKIRFGISSCIIIGIFWVVYVVMLWRIISNGV